MRYSSRLFLYAPVLILAILAIAAALLWQSVAGGLEDALKRDRGREIAPGVTLYFAAESVGGFPFNVDAVLDDMTVVVRTAFGPASWHTEHFAIHELTFGRAQQVYEAAGLQTLRWEDAGRTRHNFAFVPGSLRASGIFGGGRLARFDLDLNGIGSQALTGSRVQLHFRKSPGRDAIDVVASADALHLAPALRSGFGADLGRVRIDGQLVPAREFAPLFAGRDVWSRALDAWRRGKGSLRLKTFDIEWGPVTLQGSGSLHLDASHRATGDLVFAMRGTPHVRNMGADDARLARALSALTKASAGAPVHISAEFVSGAVNLELTDAPHTAQFAGTIGALF